MASSEMGLFKKKEAGPQQPAAPPAPQAPMFSPQQPGQFPAAGGPQAPQAPQPAGFFGGGPQDVPPAPQLQARQPVQQQPAQVAQPAQHPRHGIPSFPKLSQDSAPAQPPWQTAPPVPARSAPAPRRPDAAAVKEAVHRPALQAPQQPAPAAEGSDFFSELQEPESFDSSFGLTSLEGLEDAAAEEQPAPQEQPARREQPAPHEEPAFEEEPLAPVRSRGRELALDDQPLFVSVQQYVSVLDSLKDVRKSIREFERITHSIDLLKDKTLSSCKSWQGHLDDIHKKLAYIDRVLFEG